MKNYTTISGISHDFTHLSYAIIVAACCNLNVKASANKTGLSRMRTSISGRSISLQDVVSEDEPKNNLRAAKNDLIRFEISNGISSDETLVYFVDGGSDTFDPDFDARKISNGSLNISTYSYQEGIDIAINGISKTTTTNIPIKITSPNSNSCTLKITEYVNAANRNLYLFDKTTNVYTLLTNDASINLGGGLNNCLGRFFLTSTAGIVTRLDYEMGSFSLAVLTPNPYTGGLLKVNTTEMGGGDVTIEVSDLKGNTLKTISQNGTFSNSGSDSYINDNLIDLPNGIYLVRLKNQYKLILQKLLINR